MAKLVVSNQPSVPFFFDVSAPVGNGGQNLAEDVALVTFLMAASLPQVKNPKAREILQEVKVASQCTPDLIGQIAAIQDALGRQVDGRVSVATPTAQYNGHTFFLIADFNSMTRRANTSVWPRLDKITNPAPPGEIKVMINRILIGL